VRTRDPENLGVDTIRPFMSYFKWNGAKKMGFW